MNEYINEIRVENKSGSFILLSINLSRVKNTFSENAIIKKTTALSIPTFITRESGLSFFLLKKSER